MEKDALKQAIAIRIIRLDDGGFLVEEDAIIRSDGRYLGPIFGCLTTKDLLKYIEQKIGKDR